MGDCSHGSLAESQIIVSETFNISSDQCAFQPGYFTTTLLLKLRYDDGKAL